MTKTRAKDDKGQFLGDNPATPDVDEAWVEDKSEVAPAEGNNADSTVEDKVEKLSQEPATVELKTSETTVVKEKQSKESIEASVQEKLSKRLDGEVDPFIPSAQLQKEVKEIASQEGFQLTRGTEAGAALMARARRSA
jgi:hypothetical protein